MAARSLLVQKSRSLHSVFVWQHIKLSDNSLGTRLRYSLIVVKDVKKPNKQTNKVLRKAVSVVSCNNSKEAKPGVQWIHRFLYTSGQIFFLKKNNAAFFFFCLGEIAILEPDGTNNASNRSVCLYIYLWILSLY